VTDARMMDFPLTITHLLGRARALFPSVEVVSRLPDKSLHRQTYRETVERCERLARALGRLGVKPGDAVGTLSWNHRQHLECYLGLPAMGAVIHTLNIRLHPDEIAYIANHGHDVAIVVDACLLPLFDKFRDKLASVRHVLVVPDTAGAPIAGLRDGDLNYEELLAKETIAEAPIGFGFAKETPFPPAESLDERTAAMICYTSGTTGNPKGVVYSHRSTILHALAICLKDSVGIGSDDVVLPVVPMFHAAGWGTPYAATNSGAKLVFPGPFLDPASLLDLMAAEKVTVAAGVPTIWLGILQLLDENPGRWDLSSVRTMLIGGAAAPPSLIQGFQDRHGLEVTHAWGMTETNPLGTLARVKPSVRVKGPEAVMSARASQGIPSPFVEMRHVDDAGKPLPWDGAAMGELEVRGPWVAQSYAGDEGQDRFTSDGFFRTGDVVTIDDEGYVRITDRSKDVVKSGGEWISSVALENALMAHPAVLEAAVFAGRHEKWSERPIAAIVWKPGKTASDDELRAHLAPQFAKFWLPDAFVVVDQVPRTSTGKFLKTKLRDLYGDLLIEKP
jgi:fatty-acyl-CoA synthase